MDDIRKRYYKLIDLLNKYNYHYYDLNKPLVDDSEYDSLMKELVQIEKKYPDLKRKDSPTGSVGGSVSEAFSEVIHNPPMLSLGNIVSEEELTGFDQRCKKNLNTDKEIMYSAELKYDGLAVEVIYENGKMVQGSTRGNGAIGEDVTANLLTIKNIPSVLEIGSPPEYLSIRGEVFMNHQEFERLNIIREERGEPLFSNPRNAAAGSLRLIDPSITSERDLDVIFYGAGRISDEMAIENRKGFVEFLSGLGIHISEKIEFGYLDRIKKFYYNWLDNRYRLNYDIDGVVIKINDFKLCEELGSTSKAPRWATAWKFPSEKAVTVIKSVDYQVGRTGIVTPVANLSPINIGGVVIKRASLHNFSEIVRLGVKIGNSVKVARAGDVIPKVLKVYYKENSGKKLEETEIFPPKKCPSCGSVLNREDIYLRCINPECKSKRIENLKYFASKDGMDIEFIGPELIIRLYSAGKLNDISDFYRITREEFLDLDRMGEKLADKIIDSINRRKTVFLSHFLKSLGVRNVGEHIAGVIAKEVRSLDKLNKMSMDELMDIKEVGPGAAKSVYDFFHNPESGEIINKILNNGVDVLDEVIKEEKNDLMAGKTFVFTGSLAKHSRKEAESIVKKLGSNATGTVSKKTDFVVIGKSPGSKLEKARSLGIKILTEQEFLNMTGSMQDE